MSKPEDHYPIPKASVANLHGACRQEAPVNGGAQTQQANTDDEAPAGQDDVCVRPTLLQDFSLLELGQLVLNDFLTTLPAEDWPQSWRNSTTFKNDFARKGRNDHMRKLASLLESAMPSYQPSILFAQTGTQTVYRFLIDVIGALAPLPNPGGPLTVKDHAIRACKAFAEVFGPSCWTAYCRAMRFNRAHFLCAGGLKFPEAMHGFSWQDDAAMRFLHDETHVAVHQLPVDQLDMRRGTFRERERICPNRVIAIRLTWADSALVLFLNWLDGVQVIGGQQPALHPRQHQNAELLWADPTELQRSLALATRYFNAWMASAQFNFTERIVHGRRGAEPATFIVSVGSAALEKNHDKRAEELRNAVVSVLHAGPIHCHVHWVSDEGTHLQIRNATLLGADGFESQDTLDEPATKKNYSIPISPAYPADPRLRVAKSICAQAALWRVSLLVEYSRCRPFWKRIRCRRDDLPHPGSEIAVPILRADGQVSGVVSVEHAGVLKEENLRCVELVTHLYRRLRSVFELNDNRLLAHAGAGKSATHKEAHHEAAAFIKGLINIEEQSRVYSFQHVAKAYCAWVSWVLHADLVYLVVYDAQSDLFHPIGTTLSEELAVQFLTNENECTNLGLPADPKERIVWLRALEKAYGDSQKTKGGLHSLLEHAVVSRLRPNRRGVSWVMLKEKRQHFWPDTDNPRDHNNRHLFRASMRQYAKAALGLPFCHETSEHADGVLWIAWRSSNERRPVSESKITHALKAVELVTPVIAAMNLVYQYYTGDEAFNTLAFKEFAM